MRRHHAQRELNLGQVRDQELCAEPRGVEGQVGEGGELDLRVVVGFEVGGEVAAGGVAEGDGQGEEDEEDVVGRVDCGQGVGVGGAEAGVFPEGFGVGLQGHGEVFDCVWGEDDEWGVEVAEGG